MGIAIKEDLMFDIQQIMKVVNEKFCYKNVWSATEIMYARFSDKILKFTSRKDILKMQ